jgi:putative transposase
MTTSIAASMFCFLHQRERHLLCSILDGYCRSIVRWDLRESMTEAEIEVILQRARENGKLERWHKSLKSECFRPGTPLTREDAVRLIQA